MHFLLGLVVHVVGWLVHHLFPGTDPALGHAVSAVGAAYAFYHIGEVIEELKKRRAAHSVGPVEPAGQLGGSPFDGVKHAIEHALRGLASSLESSLKSVGESITSSLKTLANTLEEQMKSLASRLESSLKSVESGLEKDLKSAAETAQEDLKKVGHAVEAGVKEAVTGLEKLALSEIAKRALSAAEDVIHAVSPGSITIQVGPVQVDIDNPVKKLEEIAWFAKSPPKTKAQLLDFVKKVSPEVVTLSIDAQLSLVLVTSSSLQIGFSASWNSDDFVRNATQLLDDFHWS